MIPDAEKFKAKPESSTLSRRPATAPFFKKRRRIYTGLLLFVVVVGLPIVGLPYLRHRLSLRMLTLRTAIRGHRMPVQAKVGENQEPFPAEYEKIKPLPARPPQLPPLDRIFTMEPGSKEPPAAPRSGTPPSQMAQTQIAPIPSVTSEDYAEQDGDAAENEPKYQQGIVEQEAYDLLLQSNSVIAAMVLGSNPSLSFESWGAANRGEDTYWVQLKFRSAEKQNVVEYIWQVKLLSKQIIPLSHNARTIS